MDIFILHLLRSKTLVLGLLCHIQLRLKPEATPLSVIRPILTRWTSHYIAFRRLLQLHTSIQTLIEQDEGSDESEIITGTTAAKSKAIEMIAHLKDDSFWIAIKRYVFTDSTLVLIKSHLEPLAYAANITQSNSARLDTVLLVFALLYTRFDCLSNTADTQVARAACTSINNRWMASNQDVFIAAVVLNLAHKAQPFVKSSWFSAGLLTVLMCRLWS
ncbi:hypothetical protein BC835DRAFT_1284976 [Cytidiella melzeri]|nr:hypothetical protein BC835DRAFT_1284976 [Cytidiella melzeri]